MRPGVFAGEHCNELSIFGMNLERALMCCRQVTPAGACSGRLRWNVFLSRQTCFDGPGDGICLLVHICHECRSFRHGLAVGQLVMACFQGVVLSIADEMLLFEAQAFLFTCRLAFQASQWTPTELACHLLPTLAGVTGEEPEHACLLIFTQGSAQADSKR